MTGESIKETIGGPMDTVWDLYECERGNRWSSVSRIREQRFDTQDDGTLCYFSGCAQDHTVRHVRQSTDGEETGRWFHSIYRQSH